MKASKCLFIVFFSLFLFACQEESGPSSTVLPNLSVENAFQEEGNTGESLLEFFITLSNTSSEEVTVEFITTNGTAMINEDFKLASGQLSFAAGETQKSVVVELIPDEEEEEDESFELLIFNVVNATIAKSKAEGVILNDDGDGMGEECPGYITPDNYVGYELVWADEFDGDALNLDDWYYETGAGGWGNNELQNYVSGSANTTVKDGKLTIEAKKIGSNYTSARLVTRGNQFFKYGRIDIRAKLPKGQGIWPALWMLGEKFSTIGWPACGEIDIMELVGHEPNTVHGTAHWENQGSHAEYGDSYVLSSGEFADEFHVFTIKWNAQEIRWFVDDVQYNVMSITPGELSEFKDDFFFIFNVAVGGNWPGSPDASTVFPQTMVVDYVRVFQ